MAQMPDIKPEVNKEPEKKRGGGFLSSLFGGGGGGGSGAAGLGGLGGSAAGGGGLLATKTGLLALVLAGTTVAGGIGVAGYKMFGPGDSDQPSQNIQLFAAKPKDAAPDPNAAAAPKDGTSASLDNFARVNSGALKGDTPAASEAAPKDETAADADAGAAAGASAGSPNAVAGAGGSGASTSMLKNTKKLGALSTSFGGGAGSAPSAGGSSKAGDGGSLGAVGKAGQLSGGINAMGRGVGAASNARSAGARSRRTGAQAQARFARDMGQQNKASMQTAGRGFENSVAGAGGENIGDPNSISMGGAGAGTGAASRSIPKPLSGDTKEVKPPEPPKTYDVTPYKKEMGIAKLLVLLGAGLLYYISTLAKERVVLKQTALTAEGVLTKAESAREVAEFNLAAAVPGTPAAAALYDKVVAAHIDVANAIAAKKIATDAVVANETLIKSLCIAAGAVGAAVAALGMKIMGGDYGQKGQGQILILVGGAITTGSVLAYSGTSSPTTTMLIAAGAGIAGMMGDMMMKPKTCKSTEAGNADKCTSSIIYKSPGSPSEKALEEYLT